MPIRAIIFDLGRTLVPFDLGPLQAHFPDASDRLRHAAAQLEIGRLAPPAFQAALGLPLSGAAFDAWWNSIFEDRWLISPDWIASLLPRYRVGLLSNTNPVHFAFLRGRMPLLDDFAFHTLSYAVGAAKPHADMFAAAERAAACAPEEILYLDDLAEFVAAARRRGWNAEVFTGPAILPEICRSFGIEPPA